MVCVSATLPHEVLEMTGKFMTDPVRVLVKRDELTLEVRPPSLSLPRHSPLSNHIHARTHRVSNELHCLGRPRPHIASTAPSLFQAMSQGRAGAGPVSSVRRDTWLQIASLVV